jgi:Endonuclease/Exonuclease/phosphatase family 2/PX domain
MSLVPPTDSGTTAGAASRSLSDVHVISPVRSGHRASTVSQLKSIELSIPNVAFQGKGGQVVYYEIRFTQKSGARTFTDVAFHRFSEFVTLHSALKKSLPDVDLPVLPKKKVFGNLQKEFVDKRRLELERYVVALQFHMDARVSQNKELLAFLPEAYARFVQKALGHIDFRVTDVGGFGKREVLASISPLRHEISFLPVSSSDQKHEHIALSDFVGLSDIKEDRCTMTYLTPFVPPKVPAMGFSYGKRGNGNGGPGRTNRKRHDAVAGPNAAPTKPSGTSGVLSPRARTAAAAAARAKSTIVVGTGHGAPTSLIKRKKRVLQFKSVSDCVRFTAVMQRLESLQSPTRMMRGMGKSPSASPAKPSTATTAAAMMTVPSIPEDGAENDKASTIPRRVRKPRLADQKAPISSQERFHITAEYAHSLVSIFTSTWNMAKLAMPDDLEAWFSPGDRECGLIAIGLQECPLSSSDAVVLERISRALGSDYHLIGRKSLWEMRLFVFGHHKHVPPQSISNISTASVATGIMGIMGNKGGVAVSFSVHNTSICFVNTHLAPHQGKYNERNRMFHDIARALRVGDESFPLSLRFDMLFWIGDLNYRIDLPHNQCTDLIRHGNFKELYLYDQLLTARFERKAFAEFYEGSLVFPPSYKFRIKKKDKKSRKGGKKKRKSTLISGSVAGSSADASFVFLDQDGKEMSAPLERNPMFTDDSVSLQFPPNQFQASGSTLTPATSRGNTDDGDDEYDEYDDVDDGYDDDEDDEDDENEHADENEDDDHRETDRDGSKGHDSHDEYLDVSSDDDDTHANVRWAGHPRHHMSIAANTVGGGKEELEQFKVLMSGIDGNTAPVVTDTHTSGSAVPVLAAKASTDDIEHMLDELETERSGSQPKRVSRFLPVHSKKRGSTIDIPSSVPIVMEAPADDAFFNTSRPRSRAVSCYPSFATSTEAPPPHTGSSISVSTSSGSGSGSSISASYGGAADAGPDAAPERVVSELSGNRPPPLWISKYNEVIPPIRTQSASHAYNAGSLSPLAYPPESHVGLVTASANAASVALASHRSSTPSSPIHSTMRHSHSPAPTRLDATATSLSAPDIRMGTGSSANPVVVTVPSLLSPPRSISGSARNQPVRVGNFTRHSPQSHFMRRITKAMRGNARPSSRSATVSPRSPVLCAQPVASSRTPPLSPDEYHAYNHQRRYSTSILSTVDALKQYLVFKAVTDAEAQARHSAKHPLSPLSTSARKRSCFAVSCTRDRDTDLNGVPTAYCRIHQIKLQGMPAKPKAPTDGKLQSDAVACLSEALAPASASKTSLSKSSSTTSLPAVSGSSSSWISSNGTVLPPMVEQNVAQLRPYNAKRIPSWCDRILWTCVDPSQVDQEYYDIRYNMKTSDHLPIVSKFQVKLYKHAPVEAYVFPCEIHISSLELQVIAGFSTVVSSSSDSKSDTADTLQSAADDIVDANATSAIPSAGDTPDDKRKLYVSFHGAFLSETSRGKRTAAQIVAADADEVAWNESNVPMLQTVVGTREAVCSQRIWFRVREGNRVDAADHDLAHGVLHFSRVADADSWYFTSSAHRDGAVIGSLRGQVHMVFHDDMKSIHGNILGLDSRTKMLSNGLRQKAGLATPHVGLPDFDRGSV